MLDIDHGRIEGLFDLRLKPCLLVEADIQVGQQNQFRLGLTILLESGPLLIREGLPKESLSGGRIAGA